MYIFSIIIDRVKLPVFDDEGLNNSGCFFRSEIEDNKALILEKQDYPIKGEEG